MLGAWGGPSQRLFRWNGKDWSASAHPGGQIRAIHGVRDDLIVAVGNGGLASRWDGRGWKALTCDGVGLNSVAVVSEDCVYATSVDGELFGGSTQGLTKWLDHDEAIHCLAWFRDELWVGVENGLHKLVDGKLELVKDNIVARAMDARGDLLMAEDSRIAFTSDGQKFQARLATSFAANRAGTDAMWAPGREIDRRGHET